jgi:Flp pilus assembly protein TadG
VKCEKGQATVELALTITVLTFLIFGMIDFGKVFYSYLTLEHASREAARSASVGKAAVEVTERAKEEVDILTKDDVIVEVTPEDARVRGTYVTVTLTYPVSISTPLIAQVIPNPFVITSTTVMRVE